MCGKRFEVGIVNGKAHACDKYYLIKCDNWIINTYNIIEIWTITHDTYKALTVFIS